MKVPDPRQTLLEIQVPVFKVDMHASSPLWPIKISFAKRLRQPKEIRWAKDCVPLPLAY